MSEWKFVSDEMPPINAFKMILISDGEETHLGYLLKREGQEMEWYVSKYDDNVPFDEFNLWTWLPELP